MIITIDGPSGTGKSTIARKLAEDLKFDYLESGAMYRAIAYQILTNKIDVMDLESIEALCTNFNFHSQFDNRGSWHFFLGQEEITDKIFSSEVAAIASKIATYPFVRKAMAALQRQHGKNGHLVCEGRDIGSVIFPDAELKIFLTASADVRAKRRFDQMKKKFPNETFDFDEIKQAIIARDTQDANRELAPLKKPENAYTIDTTEMTIEEVVDTIKKLVKY